MELPPILETAKKKYGSHFSSFLVGLGAGCLALLLIIVVRAGYNTIFGGRSVESGAVTEQTGGAAADTSRRSRRSQSGDGGSGGWGRRTGTGSAPQSASGSGPRHSSGSNPLHSSGSAPQSASGTTS